MIPRVARLGTGFKGAGLYYLHDQRSKNKPEKQQTDTNARPAAGNYMLHDKKGALTSHRVGFTATRNLPTTDPQKALRCMSWLAANAQSVKQAAVGAAAKAAGLSYADYVSTHNPYRGRKGQKPVYTLSIAWHPTKNKTPSRSEMLQAADEVLKTLGLEDRQALIVQHTDTKHPHVHLIINRVSPVNGKYSSVSNDYLRLSKWALDYEKRTGLVLCHERMFRWRERDKQRMAKQDRRRTDSNAKGRYVRGKDIPRRDHEWFKKHAHLPPDEIREARKQRQENEVERFATRQASTLLKLDQKLESTLGRELANVNKEIDKKQSQFAEKPPRSAGLKGSAIEIIRKVADSLTLRPFFRTRAIARLQKSSDDLEDLMELRKKTARDKLSDHWVSLETRHAAERQRDKERINRLKSKGRSEAKGQRTKKQFNIRGDQQTAKYMTGKIPQKPLHASHGQAADKKHAEVHADKTLFARLAHNLGGSPIRKDRSREQALGPPVTPDENIAKTVDPQQSISTHHEKQQSSAQQMPDIQTEDDRQAQNQPEKNTRHASHSPEGGDEYQARVARRIDKLERAEKKKRKRRKRKRPRGKVRRME